MKAIAILIAMALAGCASTSGVHQAGPGMYTVTATASHGAGGSAKAKGSAYADAERQCAKSGGAVEVISEKVGAPTWTDGMHSVDLVFRCSRSGS
jgi:hypothetical protein